MTKEIYIDGGCKPNPGMMRIAICIPELGLEFTKDDLGKGTANRAEYLSLIYALKLVKDREGSIIFYTDSQLVWGQMTQGWKVNKNLDLFKEAMSLFEHDHMKIVKIPRNLNEAGKLLE